MSNCQICKNKATWHDLGTLEIGRINLVCDDHLPPDQERKDRKWVRNKYGWYPSGTKPPTTKK